MAGIRLTPPEALNFKQPDEWAIWKKRFEQFRWRAQSSKSAPYSTALRRNQRISCLPPMLQKKKKYETVMEKFNSFFKLNR
jgi:hypothetical protein